MIRRMFFFSVVCGLVITPLDALQVAVGVETIGAHPWITTIQFAVVGVVLAWVSKILDPRPHPEPLQAVVTDGALFGGGYLCTLLQAKGAGSSTTVYYIALLIVMAWRAWTAGLVKETLVFSALLAVAGPCAEALIVHMGGFQYAPPTVLGIPVWLPLQYASAGPLVRGLAAAPQLLSETSTGGEAPADEPSSRPAL